jgi:hypothetical protein
LRLAAVAGATFSHSRRQLLAPAVHGRAFRRPFTFTLPCLATLAQSKRAGDNITYKADNPPLRHQHASIPVIKTASARGAACLQLPLSLTRSTVSSLFLQDASRPSSHLTALGTQSALQRPNPPTLSAHRPLPGTPGKSCTYSVQDIARHTCHLTLVRAKLDGAVVC